MAPAREQLSVNGAGYVTIDQMARVTGYDDLHLRVTALERGAQAASLEPLGIIEVTCFNRGNHSIP